MRLPIRQVITFVRSPRGRKLLQGTRTRLDTPENRRKVTGAVGRVRNRGRTSAGSAGR